MRTLGLLRHAKSAYPAGVRDHDRPLSDRGRRDATAAGAILHARLGTPDLVVVSGARRAQETWVGVAAAWTHPPHHVADERVYEASVEDLLLLIRGIADGVESLLMVGHNPGFEELAFALAAGDSDPVALELMEQKYPTCGLAVFAVPEPWQHVVHRGARLASFDVPRG